MSPLRFVPTPMNETGESSQGRTPIDDEAYDELRSDIELHIGKLHDQAIAEYTARREGVIRKADERLSALEDEGMDRACAEIEARRMITKQMEDIRLDYWKTIAEIGRKRVEMITNLERVRKR